MYCGNCFRDNALVRALRQQAHAVTMVPLYLPMTLDEEDQSAGTPIFLAASMFTSSRNQRFSGNCHALCISGFPPHQC